MKQTNDILRRFTLQDDVNYFSQSEDWGTLYA
jgi:hypothetical protein